MGVRLLQDNNLEQKFHDIILLKQKMYNAQHDLVAFI